MVQAGDKCDFIGTLIAIPDVAQLAMQSESIQSNLCCIVAMTINLFAVLLP